VLGAFERLPTDTTWADGLPAFDSDVATIAPVACELGSEGCTVDLLTNLAVGGVDVVLLDAAAALSEGDALVEARDSLAQLDLTVVGASGEAVDNFASVAIGTIQVNIYSVNLQDPTVNISSLEQSVSELGTDDATDIALVLWVEEASRAPSVEKVSIVEGLIDAGADAVIGSGSVHLQRAERVSDALVAYNLGHAATLRDDPLERDTAILRLVIDSPTESSCLLPATAGPEAPTLDNPSALWCG
jgi:hypothetical protein